VEPIAQDHALNTPGGNAVGRTTLVRLFFIDFGPWKPVSRGRSREEKGLRAAHFPATKLYVVIIVSNWNCVYPTAYPLVWCPQYRHGSLTGEVASPLAAWLDGGLRRARLACKDPGNPARPCPPVREPPPGHSGGRGGEDYPRGERPSPFRTLSRSSEAIRGWKPWVAVLLWGQHWEGPYANDPALYPAYRARPGSAVNAPHRLDQTRA
jgi:hypothetical protein